MRRVRACIRSCWNEAARAQRAQDRQTAKEPVAEEKVGRTGQRRTDLSSDLLLVQLKSLRYTSPHLNSQPDRTRIRRFST